MTTHEFFSEMKAVRDQFRWKLEPNRAWVPDRRTQTRLHIRGVARTGPAQGKLFEPIGAVCYALRGAVHEEKSWRDAAKALDLLSNAAAELTAAANDRTWAGSAGEREPVERLQALRDRMMAVVGLGSDALHEETVRTRDP